MYDFQRMPESPKGNQNKKFDISNNIFPSLIILHDFSAMFQLITNVRVAQTMQRCGFDFPGNACRPTG